MVPRAVEGVRKRFPNLLIDMDVLKFEEALDYILLGKGEAVAMSSRFDHPMLTFRAAGQGPVVLHRAGGPCAGAQEPHLRPPTSCAIR